MLMKILFAILWVSVIAALYGALYKRQYGVAMVCLVILIAVSVGFGNALTIGGI